MPEEGRRSKGRLGEFEVLRELGRGGMGVVYEARETSLERTVALKVLPRYLSQDPEFVKRFEREARAVARLNHASIVTIYAVGEQSGRHFIAMEYVRGLSLAEIVRREGPLEPRHAVEIIMQAAGAIEEAHRQGIIHRDVKPENIMVDEDGRVKVLDFGLAKALVGATKLTTDGAALGTPHYMAPEQCKGGVVDTRTDIYALGATLFELLTGRPPFDAETPLAVLYQITKRPFPKASSANPDVPPELDKILAKMVAKNPKKRYASARTLIQDLHAFLAPRAPVEKKRRIPYKTILAVAASLLVVAGLVLYATVIGPRLVSDLEKGPVVTFPDANLETAIRAAVKKPKGKIYRTDLFGVGFTSLKVQRENITDLTGIENCTDLIHIELANNRIANIGPLASLTQLTTAYLYNNAITDVSALADLTSLSFLHLGHNGIVDISPLSTLSRLDILQIDHNKIEDATALGSLTNLSQLHCESNLIEDISSLGSMRNLRFLSLGGNRIADIAPLQSLQQLEILYVDGNPISDLTPLTSLTHLKDLAVSSMGISDLDVLSPLVNLSILNFSFGKVSDLSPLESLEALQRITGRGCRISDLTPLAALPDLRNLDLGYNQITDIGTVADLTSLDSLTLDHNQISDLSPLAGLTNLTQLNLDANPIADVAPLAQVTTLGSLRLCLSSGATKLVDLRPLAGLKGMKFLALENNNITDLTPLAGLTNLEGLWLGGNPIHDIGALVANPGLDKGDSLYLTQIPLGQTALCEDVPALEARGVIVTCDLRCGAFEFKDPNLEKAVRDAVDKSDGDIYGGDIAQLTTLTASSCNIGDLAGLEHCGELTTLDLSANHIRDLSPLAQLQKLSSLDLRENEIADVTPLAGIKPLSTLWLSQNRIASMDALAELENLGRLYLGENEIEDIAPLAGLRAVQNLYLNGNGIKDLSPLAGLENLNWLYLDNNRIEDLTPLVANSGLGKGARVYMAGNPLSRKALCEDIPALEARGATLTYDGTCPE